MAPTYTQTQGGSLIGCVTAISLLGALCTPVVCVRSCSQDFALKEAFCGGCELTSIPTGLLPDLLTLQMFNNLLTMLRNQSFVSYPYLQEVNLGSNNISYIANGTFLPLKHLRVLSLSDNEFLPAIDGNIFIASALLSFDVQNCNLKRYPDKAFDWIAQWSDIILSGNNLSEIHWTSCRSMSYLRLDTNNIRILSNETFTIRCMVLELDLSQNPLQDIEVFTLSALKVNKLIITGKYLTPLLLQINNLFLGVRYSQTLTEVTLMSANLTSISNLTLEALHGSSLRKLDLSINHINSLADGAFSHLNRIQELVLSDNYVTIVKAYQFTGMKCLRVLTIASNIISTIDTERGKWNLTNIVELSLADNKFRELKSSYFQGLHTLRHLDLRYNADLQSIANGTFDDCASLEFLDTSYTNIINFDFHIPSLKTFMNSYAYCSQELIRPGHLGNSTPLVERLELVKNSLGPPDLWDPVRHISSFHRLYSLLYLDLSKNHLSDFPVGIFQNLSSLQWLRLDECELFTLSYEPFIDLRSLEALSLIGNYLQSLPGNLLHNAEILKFLFLNQNELTYLTDDFFEITKNLTRLDLSQNRLYGLNESTVRPLYASLVQLDLSLNPLVCNCHLAWIADWLQDWPVTLIDGEITLCSSGDSTLAPFRGAQLITFDPGKDCEPNIIIYSCVALVGTALLLSLVFAYYNRWWIRYRLFLLKLCFIGYNQILDDLNRNDYEHDIAFIFHEADDEWVHQEAIPALADRLPDYDRIARGDEDLVINMYYLDAVHQEVESSFKVVCVISKEAVNDHWFMLKFRTALDHVNDSLIEKMTLVFVEDLDDDDLPFLVRLFLSDHRPYLKWMDDPRGREYFWEELVKNLTVNVRCNNYVPP